MQTVPTRYSPEATAYLQEVRRKQQVVFAQIASLPLACLIWEPLSNNTPLCMVRNMLRTELIRIGHLAASNEELSDPRLPFSELAQKIASLEAYDIVFSIPDSLDSFAEIRELARLPHLAHKIIAYFDRGWGSDQMNLGLMEFQASISSAIVPYDEIRLPEAIIDHALQCALRFQEGQYIMGRRI